MAQQVLIFLKSRELFDWHWKCNFNVQLPPFVLSIFTQDKNSLNYHNSQLSSYNGLDFKNIFQRLAFPLKHLRLIFPLERWLVAYFVFLFVSLGLILVSGIFELSGKDQIQFVCLTPKRLQWLLSYIFSKWSYI